MSLASMAPRKSEKPVSLWRLLSIRAFSKLFISCCKCQFEFNEPRRISIDSPSLPRFCDSDRRWPFAHHLSVFCVGVPWAPSLLTLDIAALASPAALSVEFRSQPSFRIRIRASHLIDRERLPSNRCFACGRSHCTPPCWLTTVSPPRNISAAWDWSSPCVIPPVVRRTRVTSGLERVTMGSWWTDVVALRFHLKFVDYSLSGGTVGDLWHKFSRISLELICANLLSIQMTARDSLD
jgi:hypothetical protein